MEATKGARRGAGRAVSLLLMACGIAAMAFGLLTLGSERAGVERYDELARRSDPAPEATAGQGAGGAGRDWDALRRENPDVAAWVSVAGTGIDYPVMRPGEDKPDGYYLSHDMWGRSSSVGTPYLQPGSEADGAHSLVYGHHMGMTGRMFSPVSQTYRQTDFDRVGDLTWETPSGTTTLHKAFAMSVDMAYAPIQTYEFADEQGLREWLGGLSADATAFADGWEGLVSGAHKVVTTVTCSSLLSGQRPRTLTVFVA